MTMLASKLSEGLWAARCQDWEVLLDGRSGRWAVTVSRCEKQLLMGCVGQRGFTSPQDAAVWATGKLKDHGIAVFLLSSDGGPPKTLVDYLDFAPATS